MKFRYNRLTILLAIIALLSLAMSCADDVLDIGYPSEFPEGNTVAKFVMDYEPFSNSGASTRGVKGDVMNMLDDICLVAYDEAGQLMEGFPMNITESANHLSISDHDRTGSDASNGVTDDKKTKRAEFTAGIPYGRYYLYAVSNLGRRDESGKCLQTSCAYLESIIDDIQTRNDFLTLKTEWNKTNPYDNFQMLGYFCNRTDDTKVPFTSETENDVRVVVDTPQKEIHCWLRRCASKVTIDFDGSALDSHVKVYIRRATIHDIPAACMIGRPNKPSQSSELISFKNEEYRPTGLNIGNTIQYGEGDAYSSWPALTSKEPKFLDNPHAPDAESLFLYENMQGQSTDEKNKEQLPDSDGTVVGATDKKDQMPYGSYIEVEGYYEYKSISEQHKGKIIYRFMLGKDEINNFDVERNYHLKLTMKIRGRGNDVDWHIEYDREEGFEWRNPYYVSYVYNQSSTIHFNYTPKSGCEVERIEAEIVANNWWPTNSAAGVDPTALAAQNHIPAGFDYQNDWDLYSKVSDAYKYKKSDFSNSKFQDLEGRYKYLGNGFLSLYHEPEVTLTYNDVTDEVYDSNTWASKEGAAMINDLWFYGKSSKVRKVNGKPLDQSKRTYYIGGKSETDDELERYTVEKHDDNSLRVNIPVFTRPKNLVKETAYSGNNPYDGSTREAYVLMKIYYKGSTGESPDDAQIMRVEQVRRLTNPKGIYRSYNNHQNFDVELLELDNPGATEFTSFTSDGPWLAEVIGDPNFINLNGRSSVKGNDGSTIKFQVQFNKMNRTKTPRNAIIRVRYNNYSCVHLIFVRQGYSAQAISEKGTEWQTLNMIHKNLVASDPRDEGSMFKYGDPEHAIDVYGNCLNWDYNILPEETYFVDNARPKDGKLYLADNSKTNGDIRRDASGKPVTTTWTSFYGNITENRGGIPAMRALGLATVEQYAELFGATHLDEESHIKHGFGVLYADGATKVQSSLDEAWNYNRHDEGTEKRGMRGLFVYYWDGNSSSHGFNCRNIFFPIGRAGFGQRRSNDRQTGDKSGSIDGSLRYAAGRYGAMPASARATNPQFFDLYRRQGAIYWASEPQYHADITGADDRENDANGLKKKLVFDINYYTFDVNIIGRNNVQKHTAWSGCTDDECINACFMRRCGSWEEPTKSMKF